MPNSYTRPNINPLVLVFLLAIRFRLPIIFLHLPCMIFLQPFVIIKLKSEFPIKISAFKCFLIPIVVQPP